MRPTSGAESSIVLAPHCHHGRGSSEYTASCWKQFKGAHARKYVSLVILNWNPLWVCVVLFFLKRDRRCQMMPGIWEHQPLGETIMWTVAGLVFVFLAVFLVTRTHTLSLLMGILWQISFYSVFLWCSLLFYCVTWVGGLASLLSCRTGCKWQINWLSTWTGSMTSH